MCRMREGRNNPVSVQQRVSVLMEAHGDYCTECYMIRYILVTWRIRFQCVR
jgi:hypothetical protein